MYRLLIVDDEAFIVNGLVEMVEEAEDLDVEVYKAYSAFEALEWLQRTKIDIVLSDINMPAMDGLELHRNIAEQWPSCKIIFLTGFNDFSYVKEALRNQAVDYILKMEGDETIRAGIKKAINQLDAEFEIDSLVAKAKNQMQAALPCLQRDYVLCLLREGIRGKKALYDRFDDYKIPFDADSPVLLINGMVDEWPQSTGGPDRELMLYAARNISEELLTAPHLRLFSVSYERRYLVLLIQTNGNQYAVLKYVQGMLERIQSVCRELLSLKLSFTVSSEFVDWNRLNRKYEVLRWIMNRSSALGQELLISDDSLASISSQSDDQLDINQLLDNLSLLEEELERGSPETFRRAYLEDTKAILPYLERPNFKVTVFYKLSSVFTSYLTKEGLWEKVTEFVEVEDLMPDALSYTWDQLTAMHLRLADWIFEQKAADASQHSRKVIHLINMYIDKNLSGDLSLTRLGEVAALNPVYLSRVYKQCTGENLSDYVLQLRINKAKELITRTNGKMQDIAAEVGFDSASYFTKCFKKITALTPQEYRETMNR